MNKYHNKKVTFRGITFDSKLEARRYSELLLLKRAGVIKDLQLQPEFELIPSFKKNGKTFRKTVYKADFMYTTKDGTKVVEDTKGFKTEVYKLKKKLFEYKYPDLKITEVN